MKQDTTITLSVIGLVTVLILSTMICCNKHNNVETSPQFKVGQYLKVKSGFYEGCVGRTKSTFYWNHEIGRTYELQEVVCNQVPDPILIQIEAMRFQETDLEAATR